MQTRVPMTGQQKSRSQIQSGAGVIGLVLIVVGVLGFIPGITQNFAQIRFAGDDSTAQLFGVFQTSVLHNLVHLGTGILGLICVRTPLRSRNYLLWTGIGYLALFLYGIVIGTRDRLDLIPINDPDNALHLAFAVVMIACAILLDCGPGWARVIRRGRAEV